jgi:hypothetical protein
MASAANAGATKVMLAVAPVAPTASLTVLKDRHTEMRCAPLPGSDTADDVAAVADHLLGMEAALIARNPLNENRRLFIDQNAHVILPLTS